MAYDNMYLKGSTSVIIQIMIRDSTTGQGKTSIAYGSVSASYCRPGGTRQAITVISGAAGDAYSSGKWAEVDSTNMPGEYQFHVPNAALATGANSVDIQYKITGAIDAKSKIVLIDADLRNAVTLGLTNLDAAISSRSTLAAGAKMDIVDVPNATALTAITAAIWNALTSGMTTAGSIGKKIADWAVGTITANQSVNVAQWGGSNVTTPAVAGSPVVTLGATQAAYAPAKAGDQMALTSGERTTLAGVIWDTLTSALTTVGSIGKKLADAVFGGLTKQDIADATALATLATPAAGSVLDRLGAFSFSNGRVLADPGDGVIYVSSLSQDNITDGAYYKASAPGQDLSNVEFHSGKTVTGTSLDGFSLYGDGNSAIDLSGCILRNGWLYGYALEVMASHGTVFDHMHIEDGIYLYSGTSVVFRDCDCMTGADDPMTLFGTKVVGVATARFIGGGGKVVLSRITSNCKFIFEGFNGIVETDGDCTSGTIEIYGGDVKVTLGGTGAVVTRDDIMGEMTEDVI